MSEVTRWVDAHCHIDAPEFHQDLSQIIARAQAANVEAILLPTVRSSDWDPVKKLVNQYSKHIPGLVYTLGIHPLYINQAKESDIDILKVQIEQSLCDPRFVGIGEIGLDYFVEGLDPQRQEYFFHAQLDLAQQFHLPVILHVRRSQDAILKALRKSAQTGLLSQLAAQQLSNKLPGGLSSQLVGLGRNLYSKGLDRSDELPGLCAG